MNITILIYMTLLVPFAFELGMDNYLIRRGVKDIHWTWRVALVLSCSLPAHEWHEYAANVCFAAAPFTWFDPLLNKLRGKDAWNYYGDNAKFWDNIAKRLLDFTF